MPYQVSQPQRDRGSQHLPRLLQGSGSKHGESEMLEALRSIGREGRTAERSDGERMVGLQQQTPGGGQVKMEDEAENIVRREQGGPFPPASVWAVSC